MVEERTSRKSGGWTSGVRMDSDQLKDLRTDPPLPFQIFAYQLWLISYVQVAVRVSCRLKILALWGLICDPLVGASPS